MVDLNAVFEWVSVPNVRTEVKRTAEPEFWLCGPPARSREAATMKTQAPLSPAAQAPCTHAGRMFKPSMLAALALLASACALQPAAQTTAGSGNPGAAGAIPAARSPDDPVAASRLALTQLLALGCSQQADCATVGVGARACGGPEGYLAYAVRDTPAMALQQALQDYTKLRKKQLEARGEMSTCELLPDPGAQCSAAGQCEVLRTQPRGLPGQLAR